MPTLERWFSESARVVILGDAAHAMPPSSGQGVNMAFEDVWTLAKLLGSGRDRLQCLVFWQKMRQERIANVLEQRVGRANMQRLPEKERNQLISERKLQDDFGDAEDMSWLYQPDYDEQISLWLGDTNE
jgi:2-polyprenyl-6-methoxyphenol hydroxylase-like FAD-dependent oxidoreductase